MREKKRRGLTAILLTLLLLLSLMPTALAAQNYKGKLIHVVYDNSGSMADNYTTRWCQAKYAMEVFGAMLGESDVMTIYPLNDLNSIEATQPALTLQGSDPRRVSRIHDLELSGNASTPFGPVTLAGDALLAADGDYEKWLVIITDGAFDYGVNPQPVLDAYNEQGIKTIFLTIQTMSAVQENPAKGAWVLSASNGVDILNKITAAANQIFEHQVLPASHISQSGKKAVLDIDLSTDELIVFAQGENASVGQMKLNGSPIAVSSLENVKYSDVLPYRGARQDKSLKGVLAIYKGNFEPGQFEVEVSGASTVEFYYRPDVMVNCELRYQGQTVLMGDELYAGDYEAAMNFVSPSTGQPVQSDLLQTVNFTLTAENNGQVTTLSTASGSVSLSEGAVTLTVTAELPGNVILTDTKEYRVVPEPVGLSLQFEPNQPFYTVSDVRDGKAEFLLRATREDGTPLTAEEAAAAAVTVQDASGFHWEVEPGDEAGTWILRPSIADEDALESGDLGFGTEVSFRIGDQPFHGGGKLNMRFEQYVNADLFILVEVPGKTGYELPDIRPIRVLRPVEITLLDADKQPLDPAVAKDIGLSFRCSNGVTWKMEPTQDPSHWTLTPDRGLKLSLIGKNGNADLTIEAQGAVGDYLYRGTCSANVFFGPINPFWLMVYGIALATLLIIIGGFVFPPKLNLRGLNPKPWLINPEKGDCAGLTVRLNKRTRWYRPQRVFVPCNNSSYCCEFPDLTIEAVDKETFRIVNWDDIDCDSTEIMGRIYEEDERKKLKEKHFKLKSFYISTIDRKGKTIGTFRFNNPKK